MDLCKSSPAHSRPMTIALDTLETSHFGISHCPLTFCAYEKQTEIDGYLEKTQLPICRRVKNSVLFPYARTFR